MFEEGGDGNNGEVEGVEGRVEGFKEGGEGD